VHMNMQAVETGVLLSGRQRQRPNESLIQSTSSSSVSVDQLANSTPTSVTDVDAAAAAAATDAVELLNR